MRRLPIFVAALAVVTNGCVQSEMPPESTLDRGTSGEKAGTASRAHPFVTEDDITCRLERRFPGFAGAYLDDGSLVLNFAGSGPKDPDEVKAALNARGYEIVEQPVVRRVAYSFCKLQEWYERLSNEAFQLDGVTATDIDERVNKIWIGVTDLEEFEPQIRSIADELGIPQIAVQVEEEEPVKLL